MNRQAVARLEYANATTHTDASKRYGTQEARSGGEKNKKTGREKQECEKQGGRGGNRSGGGGQKRADRKQ